MPVPRLPASSANQGPRPPQVTAWDQPTRIFHWLLLVLIISAWISSEFAEDIGDTLLVWHRWNGLAVIVLIVWRLLWGMFGSSTSRFASFVPSPANTWSHARQILNGTAPRYLGHNPLGSLMVLALIAVLLAQASLGLFSADDDNLTGGPLHRLITEAGNKRAAHWHEWMFETVLLPLAALHIAVNLYYSVIKKEPLVRAMVTGTKPAEAYADAPEAAVVPRPMMRAFLCLIAAKAIVLGVILLAGGKF